MLCIFFNTLIILQNSNPQTGRLHYKRTEPLNHHNLYCNSKPALMRQSYEYHQYIGMNLNNAHT